jgi:hypothetical protein
MTIEYLKKNKGSSNNNLRCGEPEGDQSEKVFIVYKFVNTPIDALIAGM